MKKYTQDVQDQKSKIYGLCLSLDMMKRRRRILFFYDVFMPMDRAVIDYTKDIIRTSS